MADFEIKFNTTELVAGAEEAFKSTNEALGVQFQRRITEKRWGWPVDPSPRDIVDLGQLRDSYKGPRMLDPTLCEHSWPTEYAMAVHEGAVKQPKAVNVREHWRTISKVGRNEIAPRSRKIGAHVRNTGQTTMTARPWTRVTLREWSFLSAYNRIAKVLMQKRTQQS